MPRQSAGLLLYRETAGRLEVFLVHPGGPFWAGKDEGAWSIPKGEFAAGEDPLAAARREFAEETGFAPPEGGMIPLAPLRQPGGKIIHAWAVEGDLDPAALRSNTFTMEWPPGSGRRREFPEIDRAAWFAMEEAARKIVKGQAAFFDELPAKLRLETRSDLVCVGTFASRLEAEIARGLLESAGISAVIAADDCGGELPNLPAGGVGLLVPGDEAPEAVNVLRELEARPDGGVEDGE